ncbi:rho-associated protein kinase 1-like [Macrosteles quadrilineatus]|uniref:rho-associated protein kinase 1-like n=1 Tax=Macrosteles quadrilineatus TaxID=74068 RepID=UPI0023E2AECF|nr:rho-associated protein kinase 1-like [Macrosteles quadrilineatus]
MKDRLGRLEAELDDLLRLQENTKRQRADYGELTCVHNSKLQNCATIRLTSRSRTMFSSSHRYCCIPENTSAPLSDISRYLQHININLSKGTQAITKLATSHQENNNQNNNYQHSNHVSKCPVEKTPNEDDLFKELREEKDKRARAENQVKSLKNELKNTKCELQEKTEHTIRMLQDELRDTLEKLKQAERELQRRVNEFRSAEYLWPLKYETLTKELRVEKLKNKEAQENIRQLQTTVQNMLMDRDEYLTLQRTAGWIKDQNENLLCLVKKFKEEIKMKNIEISNKNRCLEDYSRRIKQLTVLCGKLRDLLIVTRDKLSTAENKLKSTMEHCQRLSERMLQGHQHSEDLQRRLEESKHEQTQLSQLLQNSETKNNALHSRLEDISEMMKKQNELIARQSDTIDTKEEQLKLTHETIKLQSQRLTDCENKISHFQNQDNTKQTCFLRAELTRVHSELESEKETSLIKEKIIESHQKTISEKKNDLLKKESDINELKRKLSETEKLLAIEKTNKEEFLSKIKQLQVRKEELKCRVDHLEEECLQSSEQTAKLDEIEKQIQLKQSEWEKLKTGLMKEKNEALEALACSSRKLADATDNYQMELESRQRLIDNLNVQLQEKDKQIHEAKCEIVAFTKQIQEAEERCENMKKRFETGLQSACEMWQKTMKQLTI